MNRVQCLSGKPIALADSCAPSKTMQYIIRDQPVAAPIRSQVFVCHGIKSLGLSLEKVVGDP